MNNLLSIFPDFSKTGLTNGPKIRYLMSHAVVYRYRYIVFISFDSNYLQNHHNEPGQCAAKVTQDRCLLIDASQARKLHPE
jgi:hypothetical protein